MPAALKATTPAMCGYNGYAAADKENSSRELYVYCPELLPFLKGKIWATDVSNEIKTVSSKSPYSGTIKTTNCLKCIYRGDETNKTFPPSVRAGEQVIVYNNGDSDTWYWRSTGRNDELRRTETVRFGCNATLDNISTQNDDNQYFIEMDSRDKQQVRISTSSANKEKFRYTINIDAKSGKICIGDSAENSISIESGVPRVCLKNKDNSMVDMQGKKIVIAADSDITIESKNGKVGISSKDKMIQKTDSTLDVTAKDNMTIKTDAKYHCESASSMSFQCNADYSAKVSSTISVQSGSDTNFEVGATYNINTGGSFIASFGGGCEWTGGVMTMHLGQLNVSG